MYIYMRVLAGGFTLVAMLVTAACLQRYDTEPCPAAFETPTCQKRITEDEARRIAEREGLGAGLTPWEVKFYYFGGPRSSSDWEGYVWYVANTTHQAGAGDETRASGSYLLMEGETGRIREEATWAMTA